MSTVKRVAPVEMRGGRAVTWPLTVKWWYAECLQDLNAGKHAVGCQCYDIRPMQTAAGHARKKVNACTEIVKCALELRDYEVEIECPDPS